MGPRPVPPTDSGSSTVSRKPPASTEHSQPPWYVATAVLVPPRSVVVVAVIVTGGSRGERGRARPDVVGRDEPRAGEHLLQRLQPAAVVAEAVGSRRADPLDQRRPEGLVVDRAGVHQ